MAVNNALPLLNPIHRRPLVSQATGYSRSTLYRKIKEGLFTKPISLGADKSGNACQVGWPANEVQAIIDARIAGESDENIKKLVVRLHAARTDKQGPSCAVCQIPTPADQLDPRGLCSVCCAYSSAGHGDSRLLGVIKDGR